MLAGLNAKIAYARNQHGGDIAQTFRRGDHDED